MTSSDVIVTGPPRAGSSLVSALIDHLPNAVSLNMPPGQLKRAQKMRNATAYAKWLVGDFSWQRMQLLHQQPVRDFRALDGSPLLDGLRDPRQPKNENGEVAPVEFTHTGLTPGFILASKHNELFSCLLPTLVLFEHFTIIAVIRNPLDVIASWQSLTGHSIAQAQLAMAERYWPEAQRIGESADDVPGRMAQLYELHLARYHHLREKIHIVKYEDVASDPATVGRLLGRTNISPVRVDRPASVRMTRDTDLIRKRLQQYGAVTKFYYPDI